METVKIITNKLMAIRLSNSSEDKKLGKESRFGLSELN